MQKALAASCIVYFAIAVAMTSAAATQRATQVQGAKAPEVRQGLRESELREAVAAEIKNDSRLGGAWLTFRIVPTADDETLEVFLTVDAVRANEQSALLANLLRRQAPNVPFEIRSITRLPVSQLIQELQSQIESDAALQGCKVVGAYVAPQELGADGQLLKLKGRVEDREQRDRIQDKCVGIMKLQAVWRSHIDRYLPNGQSLNVVEPDLARAEYHFNDGLRDYEAGNYRGALTEFKQGTIEHPKSLNLRYWQAICYLRLNRREEATRCLRDTVRILRVDTASQDYRNLQHSMRRVQGPLRLELIDIEVKALSERDGRSQDRAIADRRQTR